MQLRAEALRIKQMISGLTQNWTMFLMDLDQLDEIENGASNGDSLLRQAKNELLTKLKTVMQPDDYVPIAQAYEIYEESALYILLKDRGLSLIRTPGTGADRQQRPDFQCSHALGTFFIEVKTLDFQDGWVRHQEIAEDALDARAELDGRARTPGAHLGRAVAISPHRPGADATDRIETAIKKIKGNGKRDQLNYGPTVLVVGLTRLACDAGDPSSLLPAYFNMRPPSRACVSGELWHIGFGEVGDRILVLPEFEGKSNLGRRLKETGVYLEYPELMGLVFVIGSLSTQRKVFALRKLTPNFSRLKNPTNLTEESIGEILHQICDNVNNDENEGAYAIQVRK